MKIFVTGATGYIGGDALYALYNKHPDYEYAALIRTEEKASAVKKAFPSLRAVIGGLDDSDLLKQEASKADVVLRAAKAIAAGLIEGHSKESPGFWLHTGGTGILTWEDSDSGSLGKASDHIYNDWDGIDELTNLPDHAFHRNVDQIVLETGEKHGDAVKTALLCPPTIYGKGRGPVGTRSRQAYELTKLTLTGKYIPIIGAGKTRWNNLHVADLSKLFLLLTDAAAAKKLDGEMWGGKGYYIVESGEHNWAELAEKIAAEAKNLGFVGDLEKKSLAREAALDQAGFQAISWGLNSRARAERARKLLNWSPTAPSLWEEVPNIVKEEQARLENGS